MRTFNQYTVQGWGDEWVGDVIVPEAAPEGYTYVVRSTGPVILVPTVALTPVDTTPAEPEPGAWLIGGRLCVRWEGDDSERQWAVADGDAVSGFGWWDWAAAWAEFGGPGITPRRLVLEPELPEVTLPWQGVSLRGKSIELTQDPHDYQGVPVLRLTVDDESVVAVGPDTAERFGYALISAAHVAREVKP